MKLLISFLAGVLCAGAADVSMGHLHVNAKDMAVSHKFWVETMGGTPAPNIGANEAIRFPDTFVLLKKADPTGNTMDSVVQHVGFKVKSLSDYRTRLKAAGFSTDDSANGVQLMITGPDGIRIELSEDKGLTQPIVNHHIHFYTKNVDETKSWYVKTFGAAPGMRGKFQAADLPGVNLTFSESPTAGAPTKGRVLDHIGFEVRNLEAFCKDLEAKGVKFDVPFRKVPAIGLSLAFLTDPFGTYIELTEGLMK